jgi:hypothetical protein
MPQVPGWAYAKAGDKLYVNLYVSSDLDTDLGGKRVRLTQRTELPWARTAEFEVSEPGRFMLMLRLPGWALGKPLPSDLYWFDRKKPVAPKLAVNGKPIDIVERDGYAVLDRTWKKGDRVTLELDPGPMPVLSDQRVLANLGKFAVQFGPLVMCAEGIDQPDKKVLNASLGRDGFAAKVEGRKLTLSMVPVQRDGKGGFLSGAAFPMTLVPYCTWANRGRTEMTVWFARVPEGSFPDPSSTIASTSKITTSAGWGERELVDQFEAATSDDHTYPYFHWWPRRDSTEWVELAFAKETEVGKVRVYWFEDEPYGGCRLPSSWRVLARVGDAWVPVEATGAYEIAKDRWCEVSFKQVSTSGLRIGVVQPKEWSTGIHELIVE